MGPYMAPIPANASAAMLFSFFVAMVVAPWLMLRLAPAGAVEHAAAHQEGPLGRLYRRFATPVVRSRKAAWIFLISGRRRDARGLRTVRDQERYGQAAAVRQQVRDRRGGRSAQKARARGYRAHPVLYLQAWRDNCRKSVRSRPMRERQRRSISMGWSDTIMCANYPSWVNCMSISRRAGERNRTSHAIALDLRERLKRWACRRARSPA